jgi:hypothetical protein
MNRTRSRYEIYLQLASLVPEEEYIDRTSYGAIEGLWLHAINHAQKDTLQVPIPANSGAAQRRSSGGRNSSLGPCEDFA